MLQYFSDQVRDFFRPKEEESVYSVFSATCHPLIPDIPVISPCIKCGGTNVGTSYHSDDCKCYRLCNKRRGEHLHYICDSCGYDWVGPTLDQKEEQDVQPINNL